MSDNDEKYLRNRLREVREEKGWSQEYVAKDAGVSVETIKALEDHRASPNLMLSVELTIVYNKDFLELFYFKKGDY